MKIVINVPVLFCIFFTINVGEIGAYFIYFHGYLKKINIKMGKVEQINIKNQTYYFYNDQINLKDFDASLLKVDKKDYKDIDIYYIM